MVQCYPVLAFPMAAILGASWRHRWTGFLTTGFIALCIAYNFWLTYNAHAPNGLVRVGETNEAYFWKTLGRMHVDPQTILLLDNPEGHGNVNQAGKVILQEGFEQSSQATACGMPVIRGDKAICVGPEYRSSGLIPFDIPAGTRWVRATATFRGGAKEWDVWLMTQFCLHLLDADMKVKTGIVRVNRILDDHATLQCSVDLNLPGGFSTGQGAVEFLNVGSQNSMQMDELSVLAFQ